VLTTSELSPALRGGRSRVCGLYRRRQGPRCCSFAVPLPHLSCLPPWPSMPPFVLTSHALARFRRQQDTFHAASSHLAACDLDDEAKSGPEMKALAQPEVSNLPQFPPLKFQIAQPSRHASCWKVGFCVLRPMTLDAPKDTKPQPPILGPQPTNPTGGGFCGSRLKLLDTPIDLSNQTGIYVQARGDGKTYKMNCRTTRTSGEVCPSRIKPLVNQPDLAGILLLFLLLSHFQTTRESARPRWHPSPFPTSFAISNNDSS
jgi:hypothetical protein